ncbi:MAG: hypothetical protein ACI9TB_002462, partial [Parasphingorhabdus sp.]
DIEKGGPLLRSRPIFLEQSAKKMGSETLLPGLFLN